MAYSEKKREEVWKVNSVMINEEASNDSIVIYTLFLGQMCLSYKRQKPAN
jgi:hypothetical protein